MDELAPPAAGGVLLDFAAAGIGNWDQLVRIGSWLRLARRSLDVRCNPHRVAVRLVDVCSSKGGCAMSRHSPSSSIEVLDRVLRDTSAPTGARRRLLQRAVVGAAGVAAASAGILAASALADDRPDGPSNGDGSIDDWGVFTSTTEALTVTILDELLRRTSLHPEVPSEVSL
ncbi:MAG TPA: hypothetical protein VHI55_06405, partial [Gaiellaceae bacterium]|nr:hypothetical protein [Gaiellaceae bacterium]